MLSGRLLDFSRCSRDVRLLRGRRRLPLHLFRQRHQQHRLTTRSRRVGTSMHLTLRLPHPSASRCSTSVSVPVRTACETYTDFVHLHLVHPTDPISYRIEPLISPAMSTLKAQPLPYTKKGIFGAPASQGFTGIGQRVGQGVTDFWTSLGSGKSVSRLKTSFIRH
jgi:hypothetical protein